MIYIRNKSGHRTEPWGTLYMLYAQLLKKYYDKIQIVIEYLDENQLKLVPVTIF